MIKGCGAGFYFQPSASQGQHLHGGYMSEYTVSHPALEPLKHAHELAEKRYKNDLGRFLSAFPVKYRLRHYSLSTLQKSPKQAILGAIASRTQEINAANQHWSLFGSVIHQLMEQFPHGIRERRMGYIIPDLDVLVHHQPDLLWGGRYIDYKNVSSTSMKYDKGHWEEQFNFGAWLFEGNGRFLRTESFLAHTHEVLQLSRERVDKIYGVVQLLDWRPNNPQMLAISPEGSVVMDFEKWEPARVLQWVTDRARTHQNARDAFDAGGEDSLPPCTQEERWERDTGYKAYAYTAKGVASQKAATSEVFVDEQSAEKWMLENGKELARIQKVPGTPHQCLTYCSARNICKQGQLIQQQYYARTQENVGE